MENEDKLKFYIERAKYHLDQGNTAEAQEYLRKADWLKQELYLERVKSQPNLFIHSENYLKSEHSKKDLEASANKIMKRIFIGVLIVGGIHLVQLATGTIYRMSDEEAMQTTKTSECLRSKPSDVTSCY